MPEPEHRTLWEVLDASLWGKPLGLVVLLALEFSVLAVVCIIPLRMAMPMVVDLGYLEMGPWYYTMAAVLLVGLLVLSVVHAGASSRNPGYRLVRRVMAAPPERGTYTRASAALKQVQLAAGLSPYPLLRVYPAPFPNGFSFSSWDGRITIGLSSEAVESLETAELTAVVAHLVARAQAPASHWLALAATMVEPLPMLRVGAQSEEPSPIWLLVGFAAFVFAAALGPEGISALVVFGALLLSTLMLMVVGPLVVRAASRLALPGLDLWGDSKGLYYVKDPAGMLRAAKAVLNSDNVATAGPYEALFFAPTRWGRAVYGSESKRIAHLEMLAGAQGVGVDAEPLVVDSDRLRAAGRLID